MKRLLLVLALLLIPSSASTMLKEKEAFWFCAQPGSMTTAKVLATSGVHKNMADWSHQEKAKQFEEIVKKQTKGEFEGQFEALCMDHTTQKEAHKYLDKLIKRAEKLGFKILQIDILQERRK